jgi:hypothetical protein
MLDADLAELYGVPTKVFNQAVKRNAERFPEDFMFQINRDEAESLRSQIVTTLRKCGLGRLHYPRPMIVAAVGIVYTSNTYETYI